MVYVYKITNTISGRFYFGITSTSIKRRWATHKSQATKGKAPISCAIRSYGPGAFIIEPIVICDSIEYAAEIEIALIASHGNLYNLHRGGSIGYSMAHDSRRSEWINKLSKARQGATPALGMKHTEENKQLFKDVSRKYWDSQELYDIEAVSSVSFKEAQKKFGISKTHYYRLKRGSRSDAV